MIRLDNISKQNGHQILFIDVSMGLQTGEKAGLVGPNGAGNTTQGAGLSRGSGAEPGEEAGKGVGGAAPVVRGGST